MCVILSGNTFYQSYGKHALLFSFSHLQGKITVSTPSAKLRLSDKNKIMNEAHSITDHLQCSPALHNYTVLLTLNQKFRTKRTIKKRKGSDIVDLAYVEKAFMRDIEYHAVFSTDLPEEGIQVIHNNPLDDP